MQLLTNMKIYNHTKLCVRIGHVEKVCFMADLNADTSEVFLIMAG